jgi:SAM-dependent methyltransferase
MRMAHYFDEAYREYERYWWAEQHRYSTNPFDHSTSLITQQVLRLLAGSPPGRALDLGAGEGADAIRLAIMGYSVDAVEISPVGAGKIRRFAEEAGVSVRIIRDNVEVFRPSGPYNVILCNGLLHYIEAKEEVIRRMQEATVGGGLNAVSLWSSYTPIPESHRTVDVYADDEDGIVATMYKDWRCELFYLERDKLETSHPDPEQHRHSYIKLIARKPTHELSRR